MSLGIVILAAGQGTRMKSALPKVLHPLAGKPLLGHVLHAARALEPAQLIVIHGHGSGQVQAAFPEADIQWIEQAVQRGTGDAVRLAVPALSEVSRVLVLYGDVPLIEPSSLHSLLEQTHSALGLLTVFKDDPKGYGRLVRDEFGNVMSIVEHKDATPDELAIKEVNTGIMVADARRLESWLSRLAPNNAQGEYYLTDILGMAVDEGVAVHVAHPGHAMEAEGVNDRKQLATLERWHQLREADKLMLQGVSLADPSRFDLRGTLQCGRDVFLDINLIVEGEVTLGDNVRIGANCVLRNVQIGDNVQVLENSVLEDAIIGADCRIGPFSRIRPGTRLAGHNHVGNFVELKNAQVDQGTKINHLSYVGDADVGARTNIGAGTITCNYDGANKHRTQIGDDAFIGSNTALVAPIIVESGATVGAGSTLTKNAPAGKLTLSRAKQLTLDNWQRPKKR